MSDKESLPMVRLCLPLVMEQFFRALVSSADTLMLRFYSEKAVAGVGLMAQYAYFLMLMFNVIAVGTSIVLAQYVGAKKSRDELNSVAGAATVMVLSIAVIIAIVVLTVTGSLLTNCYKLESEVYLAAYQYFMIFGGCGAVFNALGLLQSAILRCYGYTREALLISVASNIINVIGNAISLYGLFGLPVFGVKGVAWASTISLAASVVMLAAVIHSKKDVCYDIKRFVRIDRLYYKQILKVGLPSASESMSYNLAQIVTMNMISALGTFAMASNVYTRTISQYVGVVTVGMGAAGQIKAGYYVGAGQSEVLYRKMFKYSAVATAVSVSLILLANVFRAPLINLFTDEAQIYSTVEMLLKISCLLEAGKALNIMWIGALKGTGDVRFPVLYGICSNWSIMVLLGSILGLRCKMGIAGFWLGTAIEETTRGIVMVFRWKSKRWMTKRLV